MNTLKFLGRCQNNLGSLRNFGTSKSNFKALQNWTRPSIDELTVPRDPWQRVFDRNQKRFNAQLLAGVGLFTGTVVITLNTVKWNTTPDYLKSVNFVTTLPDKSGMVIKIYGYCVAVKHLSIKVLVIKCKSKSIWISRKKYFKSVFTRWQGVKSVMLKFFCQMNQN